MVVQGGPGTLDSVVVSIHDLCPVVLIADSGGVAEVLDIFLRTYKDPKDTEYYLKGKIPHRLRHFEKARGKLETIAEMDLKHRKVHSFRLSETSTARLDQHLLAAIINDQDMCKPEARLKLAVEWMRPDMVEQVMTGGGPTVNIMLALQTAVQNRSAEITKKLLAQNASMISRLSFLDLYLNATDVRLFTSNIALRERLQSTLAQGAKNNRTK